MLSRSAEAASPYAIKVTPGDVEVPKGSDQTVDGEARRLPIERRRADGAAEGRATEFDAHAARAPPATPATFEGMLFDVKKSVSTTSRPTA